jgi:hypothetical protein
MLLRLAGQVALVLRLTSHDSDCRADTRRRQEQTLMQTYYCAMLCTFKDAQGADSTLQ